MSTETHVFFCGKLPSKAALSRAMKELGFPFAIKPATGSLEEQDGFMSMTRSGEETGVEFDVFNGQDAVAEFAEQGVDPSYERVANFRWGGDLQEAVAGMCGAAALAKLVNGIVFDEAENKLLSIDAATALAREILKELPPPVKQRGPRGRTLLKRILAPLLAKRSDLALVGDLMVIRPVRHLVRGVEFRWHERQTMCAVHPYIQTLYEPPLGLMQDAIIIEFIADPDFAPMLFDRLAAEIFEPLGKIASIEDFIASRWGEWMGPRRVFPSIVVSRGVERARGDLAAIELRRVGFPITNKQRGLLAGDDAAAFSYFRAWEIEAAKGLKLEHIWEPSPFPAELPTAQRTAAPADPLFTPTPWLDFPPTWYQEPPETPGEVRYARSFWDHRHGRVRLIHPITREEAEARHHRSEYYVLATRLPENQLLILTRSASTWMHYDSWIYDSHDRYISAQFWEWPDRRGVLEMSNLSIDGISDRAEIWYSHLGFDRGEIAIYDHHVRRERKLTDADRSAYAFPPPPFGEFGIFWQSISIFLDNEGFGTFA